MWPAIVVDESLIGDHKGLNKVSGGRSVFVQFFGTHDFARFVFLFKHGRELMCVGLLCFSEIDNIFILLFVRIKPKQIISFLKGLLSSFHLKCRKPHFTRSLEEAKM